MLKEKCMSASKKMVAAVLLGVCGLASAQTIDELTDLNRQAMLADARAKLDKKKDAPATPGSAVGQVMPPALAMPPVNAAAGVKHSGPVKKAEQPVPVPVLVAIYGMGGALMTELADSGFEAKYRLGDRTPSGWTVSRIDKRLVAVTRPEKGSAFRTVLLPFGVKLDEPREKEKEVVVTTAGGLSMAPLPPSFPQLPKQ
jgi:type IV pilus biogenesis protein PilP